MTKAVFSISKDVVQLTFPAGSIPDFLEAGSVAIIDRLDTGNWVCYLQQNNRGPKGYMTNDGRRTIQYSHTTVLGLREFQEAIGFDLVRPVEANVRFERREAPSLSEAIIILGKSFKEKQPKIIDRKSPGHPPGHYSRPNLPVDSRTTMAEQLAATRTPEPRVVVDGAPPTPSMELPGGQEPLPDVHVPSDGRHVSLGVIIRALNSYRMKHIDNVRFGLDDHGNIFAEQIVIRRFS